MTDCTHGNVPGFCMKCGFPCVELRRCLQGLETIKKITDDEKIKTICEDLLDPERRYGPVREMQTDGRSITDVRARAALLDMHGLSESKTEEAK